MPIYEYRCQSCGHEQEFLQKLSDPLLTDCPECKESALKKKVSAAGFRLKGGGWYETDFKSGNKKNVAGDKPTDSGGSDSKGSKEGKKSKDSGKSEKPAKKAETKSEKKSSSSDKN